MFSFIRVLYLFAEVVWVGEMVFFSFIGAPAVFRSLPSADAGRVVSSIFPIYYTAGYVCGIIMLAGGMYLATGMVRRAEWLFGAGLVALMLAATLYAGLVLQPRVAALRLQLHGGSVVPEVKLEFDRLHKLAVTLNGGVLLGGLLVVAITARSLR